MGVSHTGPYRTNTRWPARKASDPSTIPISEGALTAVPRWRTRVPTTGGARPAARTHTRTTPHVRGCLGSRDWNRSVLTTRSGILRATDGPGPRGRRQLHYITMCLVDQRPSCGTHGPGHTRTALGCTQCTHTCQPLQVPVPYQASRRRSCSRALPAFPCTRIQVAQRRCSP